MDSKITLSMSGQQTGKRDKKKKMPDNVGSFYGPALERIYIFLLLFLWLELIPWQARK
jgi:hypothetical protein